MDNQIDEIDILRDTPIRLLGYANEIGESFRYVFPRLVKPSWAISISYCLTDTLDKSYK
jgi:fission process protein 1